jgi:predicted DNA-binding mobile mystery protein A
MDRAAKNFEQIEMPERGWIAAMRRALGMSAEQVATRKGVSRNAVYQAERSEKEGAVSLNQMEQLAAAMGGKFVYAIIPNGRIEDMKYHQATLKANTLLSQETEAHSWSEEEREDWVDDKIAELLHDMPSDFWENPS